MIREKTNIHSSLFLHHLELNVLLGWPEEERLQSQTILLDVSLRYLTPPIACSTDELTDTNCYDLLTKSIDLYAKSREFRLIEHLGQSLYFHIKQQLGESTLISLRIRKKPPIKNLNEGVSFCYGDEPWSF